MRKKIILIGLICYVFLHLRVFSQTGNYHLSNHFNSENGLPQNTIRDFFYSPSGFLWMATENGLVRYDGKKFTTYSKLNTPVSSNRFSQFFYTQDNRLYAMNDIGDVYSIQEQFYQVSLTYIQSNKGLGFSVHHPCVLNNLNTITQIQKRLTLDNVSDAINFTFVRYQSYYIQKLNTGLQIYDTLLQPIKRISLNLPLHAELMVINNNVCTRFNQKSYRINLSSSTLEPLYDELAYDIHDHDLGSPVNGRWIWDYRNQTVYSVRQNTLQQVNILGNKVVYIPITPIITQSAINTITASKDKGTLLIGTLSDGFYIYRKSEFTTITSPLSKNVYYAQAVNSDIKKVYTSHPIQEMDPLKQRMLPASPLSDYNTLHYQKQTLWYAYNDTIAGIHTLYHTETKIGLGEKKFDNIGVLAFKDSNSLYAVTSNALYAFDLKNKLSTLALFDPKLPKKRIYTLLPIGESLLFGSDIGLFQWQKKDSFIQRIGLSQKLIRSLYQTKSGLLLIGTYGDGIYVWHKDKFISLPLDKHNALLSVHAFFEDRNGYLWMSTNSGLFKIKTNNINAYLEYASTHPLYYYRYSHINGLATNEFNGGCYPSVVQVDSEQWSLPSMKGLVWFKPNQMTETFTSSRIYIDKITLDNKLVSLDSSNTLYISDNRFQLACSISSPNWTDDENLYIEYQLQETKQNEPWVLLKDNNTPIIIQNLKGGEYKLQLRKKSGSGLADYVYETIHLSIQKKIYEYQWFWPALVLLLTALVWAIIRYSNYRIEQRKQLLEKLVNEKTLELKEAILKLEQQALQLSESKALLQDENELKSNLLYVLSHDIAMPLRYINRFLNFFQGNKKEDALKKDDLNELQISTQQLENLLGNLVTWIKQTDQEGIQPVIEQVELYDLVQEQMNLFQLICKKKNTTIINHIEKQCTLNTDQFILSRALLNVLGNAVNHSNHGNIEVRYVKHQGFHEIRITDNSTHLFEPDNADNSNQAYFNQPRAGFGIGLKITQNLLQVIGGRITSTKADSGLGTTTIIYICAEK